MEVLYCGPINILRNNSFQSSLFSFYSIGIEPHTTGVVQKGHLEPGSWKFFFGRFWRKINIYDNTKKTF